MAATPSNMLELGTIAPDFSLISTDNEMVSLSDYTTSKAMLVIFICNHCPYVIHINKALVEYANDYKTKGVDVIAISANNADKYPQDNFEAMIEVAKKEEYPFPYLYDETQEIAKAYMAACTPDLYLFDGNRKLFYRGQFDASRPKNNTPVTGNDIRNATDALLNGKTEYNPQIPSIGCNIKWKPGNEPDYFQVNK